MRLVTCVCAASLLAGQAPAQTTNAPPGLIGTWEALEPRETGIGATLTFAEKGSFTITTGVLMNARYTRDGTLEAMIVRVAEPNGSTTDMTVIIVADTLTQYVDDSVVRMTRIPGFGPDTGLVGKWRFTREVRRGTTVTGITQFTADGIMRVRIPLQSQSGAYTVSGNELTLALPDPGETARFTFVGDTLTIAFPGRPPDRYVRVR